MNVFLRKLQMFIDVFLMRVITTKKVSFSFRNTDFSLHISIIKKLMTFPVIPSLKYTNIKPRSPLECTNRLRRPLSFNFEKLLEKYLLISNINKPIKVVVSKNSNCLINN